MQTYRSRMAELRIASCWGRVDGSLMRLALVALDEFPRGRMWRRMERWFYKFARADLTCRGLGSLLIISFVLTFVCLLLQRGREFYYDGGPHLQTLALNELRKRLESVGNATTIESIRAVHVWLNDTSSYLGHGSACKVLQTLGEEISCRLPLLEVYGLAFGALMLVTIVISGVFESSRDWMGRRLGRLWVLDEESDAAAEQEARAAYPAAFRKALLAMTPLAADPANIVLQYHSDAAFASIPNRRPECNEPPMQYFNANGHPSDFP